MDNIYTKWILQIRELSDGQRTSREIAEKIGCSAKYVQKVSLRENLSRRKRGDQRQHGSWKGGRITDKDGYILVMNKKHPHARGRGYVREHRLVMEQSLGRYLDQKEVVHHKNGQKADNRIENLELCSTNGEHLKKTLKGKTPQWSPEGFANMEQGGWSGTKNQRLQNLYQ